MYITTAAKRRRSRPSPATQHTPQRPTNLPNLLVPAGPILPNHGRVVPIPNLHADLHRRVGLGIIDDPTRGDEVPNVPGRTTVLAVRQRELLQLLDSSGGHLSIN